MSTEIIFDVKNVYGKLFEEVKERLEAENAPACSESAFLGTIGAEPRKISYKNFSDLNEDAFLECAFLSFFQRLPDEKEREAFKGLDKESVLKALANKGSYSIRKIDLKDCPYSSVKPGLKGRLFGMASAAASSAFLRKIAKKMPGGVQSKIRKLFC